MRKNIFFPDLSEYKLDCTMATSRFIATGKHDPPYDQFCAKATNYFDSIFVRL